MKLIYVYLILFFSTVLHGQTLSWERNIPLPSMQSVQAVSMYRSGSIAAGRNTINVSGLFVEHLSLLRMNGLGDTLYTRNMVLPGVEGYFPTQVFIDTGSNQFIIIGYGGSSIILGGSQGFFLRTDTLFNLLNFQTYNTVTQGPVKAAYALPGKEFLLTGDRNFFSGGNIDIFLTRIDSVGNILKDTSYSKPFPQEAFSIEPMYDGSYLIGGVTGTAQGPAAYALQVDLWGRVIRDTVIQTPQAPYNNTNVRLRQLSNDDWALTGVNNTAVSAFYTRLNPNFGNKPNTYRLFGTSFGYPAIPTTDSGFVVSSLINTNSSTYRRVRHSGDTLWSVTYGTSTDRRQVANSVHTDSGRMLFFGWSRNPASGNGDDYYYASVNNAGQPFLKNLCRNLPQVSMSSELDSLSQSYRVYNTSGSGLQYNPLMRWSWYLPLLNQTVTDSVLVLPTTISSPFPVELTVSHYYGCSATASANVFSVLGASSENTAASEVRLYPNPAKGAVYLQNTRPGRYEIHDLQGRSLQTGLLTAEPQQMIDLSRLSKGLYLLRFSDARESSTYKLVVE